MYSVHCTVYSTKCTLFYILDNSNDSINYILLYIGEILRLPTVYNKRLFRVISNNLLHTIEICKLCKCNPLITSLRELYVRRDHNIRYLMSF